MADIAVINPDSVVVEVKVAIGEGSTNLGTPVYIDDIGVNDAVYNLESSGDVDMEVPVLADAVSISLDTASILFAGVYPGDTVGDNFTITNEGSVRVDLSAETNSGFYDDNLTLNTQSVGSWSDSIAEGGNLLVNLELYVPHGTLAGVITGTLIIWVERSETQP